MSRKVVRVSYTVDDIFCVPDNINLEDKTQVDFWCVKYNTLHVGFVSGQEITINSQNWIEGFDYKYPSNDEKEILDAEELGLEDNNELFEPVDIEPVKK